MQYVHIEMEYEPGVGLPRSFNHKEGVEEGKLILHHTAETTSQAIRQLLDQLEKSGVVIDGPMTITAQKERQIGGDDGVTFKVDDNGMGMLHITAPDPEEVQE